MDDQFWKRLAGLFKGDGAAKGQRSTWFLLALVALGIVFMFVSATPEREKVIDPPPQSTEVLAPLLSGRSDYKDRLEKDLMDRLRRVKGVKDVTVLVTLESGPVYDHAENLQTTERDTVEEDEGGGSRQIKERTINTQTVLTRDGGGESALVNQELQPRIAGVLVIARGAESAVIREQLTLAVSAALHLPVHRISVLPME